MPETISKAVSILAAVAGIIWQADMMQDANAQDRPEQVLSFTDLPHWAEEKHDRALDVFKYSCTKISGKDALLRKACEAARQMDTVSQAQARRFFETYFEPVKITSAPGLLTGYYEPEFPALEQKSAAFSTPVLKRPDDLVDTPQQELAAMRRSQNGLVPYYTREDIQDKAVLNGRNLELFWMRPFDLFTMQVQGSGRLILSKKKWIFGKGETVRVGYDGKNGRPYTSIGKVMWEDHRDVLAKYGVFERGQVSMQVLAKAFDDDPALAHRVMLKNQSYVFFKRLDRLDPERGPIGAQGLQLTPFRSIAVDPSHHAYGLPFYIDTKLPYKGGLRDFRGIVIAQDTGTAIRGEWRADLFTGGDEQAKEIAGQLQRRGDEFNFYALQPKNTP